MRTITRQFCLGLLLAALPLSSFSGCKKIRARLGKGPEASTAAATPAPGATSPEPPSQPDLTPVASASAAAPGQPAPAAPATAAAPSAAHPPIDSHAAVMVLCYHNIEDSPKTKALTLPVAEFEKQLQELKTAGFTVIPMQDFLAWRRGEKNIPKKSCIITIDDGWASGYTTAWPLLKKYEYPFTLFIYVNYVGTGGKSLTWEQLAELRDAGVDIQSHTYSHSNLRAPGNGVDRRTADLVRKDIAALGREGWLRKEIFDSKKVLEQQLGIRVNAIAYPFGIYSKEVEQLVKEAGYEAGFTVYGQRLSRTSPAERLGRYALEAGKPKIFQDAVAMIGGGGEAIEPNQPAFTQLAAASMLTQPMNNETVNTGTPLLKANLSTMGEIEPGSLDVRVSGVGEVPATLDANRTFSAQVKQPLRPGAYTVIVAAKVAGQRVETRWNFNVAAGAAGAARPEPVAATPPPAPAAEPAPAPAPKKKR